VKLKPASAWRSWDDPCGVSKAGKSPGRRKFGIDIRAARHFDRHRGQLSGARWPLKSVQADAAMRRPGVVKVVTLDTAASVAKSSAASEPLSPYIDWTRAALHSIPLQSARDAMRRWRLMESWLMKRRRAPPNEDADHFTV